ncbi:glycoside hydrolase family 26 protein [Pricia sp.]|uniref:glycoside hydrolase family 26 protein n=1 Tax=Pricia sp. TaxID=2268138 RepID=UPI00359339BA
MTIYFNKAVCIFRNNRVARLSILFLILVSVQSCKSTTALMKKDASLTDAQATPETKYLFNRIKEMAKQGYAFGHQDATAYGMGWKNAGREYRSDVNDVAGDYPAVYGFDIGHLELGNIQNLDTVNFGQMKALIQKAHKKGGIITLSWHADNPISDGSTWDTTAVVKHIIKGGSLHTPYRAWLLRVADFLNDLRDKRGNAIPVVFRPYHEMNGSWFWWGEGNCTPEEYKTLWRETVDILSKEFGVHNVIYAYSPNGLNDAKDFLRYYPGDDYVDMLGLDIYQHGTTEEFVEKLRRDIPLLKKIALEKDMPYALTEVGLNTIPVPDWWTQVFDKEMADTGIAWALFWRNAWPDHYFAPFTGQGSSEDFVRFKNLPHVLFLDEVKKIR